MNRIMELWAIHYALDYGLIPEINLEEWIGECGTVACVAGNIPVVCPNSGISFRPTGHALGEYYMAFKDITPPTADHGLAEYFGIPLAAVRPIFHQDYYSHVSTDSVAWRIEEVLSALAYPYPDVEEVDEQAGTNLRDRIKKPESDESRYYSVKKYLEGIL